MESAQASLAGLPFRRAPPTQARAESSITAQLT